MNKIIYGDSRDSLSQLAASGIKAQMCVTSPPYFGLRSYLPDDHPHKALEIGTEKTPEEYIAKLVEIFRCVRDGLADDGTLWLNIGDSYASQGGREPPQSKWNKEGIHDGQNGGKSRRPPGDLKPKDLIGIPWMLAFALRADGAASPSHMRDIERIIAAVTASYESREQWPDRIAQEVERLEREHIDANRGGWYLRQDIIWHKPNPMPESVRDRCTKAHEYVFLLSKSERYFYDYEAIKEAVSGGTHGGNTNGTSNLRGKSNTTQHGGTASSTLGLNGQETRNKRSVWTVAPKPYAGAHFAVFPPELIEPCIKAGSRPGDIVLDPFMGSGTTAEVALLLGRQYVGCELNDEYKPLQDARIAKAMQTLADETRQPTLFEAA